jgi:hypothetical protein
VELLLLGHGGGGRPIPVMTGGKVGQGGVPGLRARGWETAAGLSERGLTGEAVSIGPWLDQSGMAVRGGVRWWWSTARGSERWPGHGRSLGWHRRSGRAAGAARQREVFGSWGIAAVVVRTRGHRHWLAGRRGSGRRWGPHGGETKGARWPEMAAVDEVSRWKRRTAWGGFEDSSQWTARGKSAA